MPDERPQKVVKTVELPVDLVERAETHRREHHLTFTALVRFALEAYLDLATRDPKPVPTQRPDVPAVAPRTFQFFPLGEVEGGLERFVVQFPPGQLENFLLTYEQIRRAIGQPPTGTDAPPDPAKRTPKHKGP